ncbi:MAG: endonuclease/exonuclease/phosphatase family protein [Acutalibacteraceae bacterium]|nr:endonuclease/exonuclease/phosphatase family protein [Acutalibacteraceae bacterium]
MIDKIISAFFALVTAILTLFYTPTPITSVNPAETPDVSATQNVTVMSYNVYYKYDEARKDNVIANIRNHNPDSFGLQEATPEWIEAVATDMPEYAYVGVGRDIDGGGEASPVFYKKDKYELIDSGTFWLSKTPQKPSKGWDAMFNRICTYVVLRNKETRFVYAHFNAHFDHMGVIARLESVTVVTEKISKICNTFPAVFTGDLNDYEGGDMYNRVLESGFRDTKQLAETADDKPTFHGYSDLLTKEKPIDFIFVNAMATKVSTYKVDTAKYNGEYASDHHPVISEMTLYN